MNEYLVLGMSVFWLVTGWLGAGFMIRRVRSQRAMSKPVSRVHEAGPAL